MRSLDLKSLVAAAKRPHGKGESDIGQAGSRSRVTGVLSRKASTALPYLGSGTPDARERVPKTRCVPLPFTAGLLPSHRLGNRVRKTEKPVRDWSKFFTAPGSGSVHGRKRKIQLATLSALKSWVLLGL
jgi:hypothetical protein